jgi:hypothetical protein
MTETPDAVDVEVGEEIDETEAAEALREAGGVEG